MRRGKEEYLSGEKGAGVLGKGSMCHLGMKSERASHRMPPQKFIVWWNLTIHGHASVCMLRAVWVFRARQVLDLRRSLQKLDMAERELATAFVGAVVSSAFPNAASTDPSSVHCPSPWAGSLGGFVPAGARGGNCSAGAESAVGEDREEFFREMVVQDVTEKRRIALNEVQEQEEVAAAGEDERAAGVIAAVAAERNSFEKSSQQRRCMNERKKSPIAVVVDSQSPPTRRQVSVDGEEAWGGMDAHVEASGKNADGKGDMGESRELRSSQQPTPTEKQAKEGLERLLNALTPLQQISPQKRASTARSSVGFRRSMRTSLSIQLGIVPSSPAVGVGSGVVTSNQSKSSSTGLGGSSRFRALGALSSSGEPTPVTSGSQANGQVSAPRSSASCGLQGEAARLASKEQHLPATPQVGDSGLATCGTEGIGVQVVGAADVMKARELVNLNGQPEASSSSQTQNLPGAHGNEDGKGLDWRVDTRSSFRHDQLEDTDQCLIGRLVW